MHHTESAEEGPKDLALSIACLLSVFLTLLLSQYASHSVENGAILRLLYDAPLCITVAKVESRGLPQRTVRIWAKENVQCMMERVQLDPGMDWAIQGGGALDITGTARAVD